MFARYLCRNTPPYFAELPNLAGLPGRKGHTGRRLLVSANAKKKTVANLSIDHGLCMFSVA